VSIRAPNAIDFWRGFALVSIFINHVPGLAYERLTHRNIGISDSAELFVFLAGWSLRGIAAGGGDPLTVRRTILRVGARGVTLYAAQIVITMLAIALLAATALVVQHQALLEWHNAASVFHDPIRTHVGLVLLTHQLGYFDILPLYVVLMFGAVLLALVHRLNAGLVLPLSLALYVFALVSQVNFPTWPLEGVWFFNPLCWQLIFVLGFVAAGDNGIGAWLHRNPRKVLALGLPGFLVGLVIAAIGYNPDPLTLPQPLLFFVIDKTYLTPLRLWHALSLFAVMAAAFPLILRFFPVVVGFLCLLGRNSLYVFCVGSLASLAGQLARFVLGGNLAVDTVILASGIVILGVTGWLSELKDRLRGASS